MKTLTKELYIGNYSNLLIPMSQSITTIQVDKTVLKELKKAKDYPEQSYNSLLLKMIELFKRSKERNQYDRFLHTVQQAKMKELWDNPDDEVWDNV